MPPAPAAAGRACPTDWSRRIDPIACSSSHLRLVSILLEVSIGNELLHMIREWRYRSGKPVRPSSSSSLT